MPSRDEMSEILADFFNTATPRQAEELKALLKKRSQSAGLRTMDFRAMARKFSATIQESIGLSSDFVRETAETAVARMIRSQVPDISEKDLRLLLEEMVPSLKREKQAPLPPLALKAMLVSFIDYSLGRMQEAQKAELGKNWTAQYWNAFPDMIRGLVSKLLHQEIDEELFWLAVDEFIRRMGEEDGSKRQ